MSFVFDLCLNLVLFRSVISVEEESVTKRLETLELKPKPSKRFSTSLEKKKEKPVFLSELSQSVSAILGETFTFMVRVSGFPKPSVLWFHNGTSINSSSVYEFIHKRDEYLLVIHEIRQEFAGEYSCTVSNRFGQATCKSYLNIEVKDTGKPPFFTKTIQTLQISEGGEALFGFIVSGNPLPEIKWFRGNFQIQPSGLCIIVTNPDGTGFFNIKSVKQEDSGVYVCKATNAFGEATCSAELLVLVKKTTGLKISLTEQNETRSSRERSDQMIYTISTDDRQIIQSEEVKTLTEVDILAATLHKEKLTHQAAVLQSHAIQERVSLAPQHPETTCAVQVKQLKMTAFASSIQEQPKITEQHSDRILSPEISEVCFVKEEQSKLMSATSEEVLPLSTVKAEKLKDIAQERTEILTDSRQIVSCPQVESAVLIRDEILNEIKRPDQEKGFKVTEGVRILYSAQLSEQMAVTESHTVHLPDLDAATKPQMKKEQAKSTVAPVSQTRLELFKEEHFERIKPDQDKATQSKDLDLKSAANVEERYQIQGEQEGTVEKIEPSVSLEAQTEGERLLNLQVFSDQDVLESEGRFTSEETVSEQAKVWKSLVLLQSVTQEDQCMLVYEKASEITEKPNVESAQVKKESQQKKHLPCVHSPIVSPKEAKIKVSKMDEYVAVPKKEKARKYAAISEEKRALTADFEQDLKVTVSGVNCEICTEPKPINLLPLSVLAIQMSKESPFESNTKQQRALVQKEEYWNILQALNVTETQALEEGHTHKLETEQQFRSQLKTEPKIPKRPVFIEENAVETESCTVLETAEQDFAFQIQEGQSVRQSVLLEEKQIIIGERSTKIHKSEGLKVSIVKQKKDGVFIPESQDSTALPKELHFHIQIPKTAKGNMKRQVREALKSAVAYEHPVLFADIIKKLKPAEIQEVQVTKQRKQAAFSCLITSSGIPLQIMLTLESDYPQKAELKSEIQVALHSMVSQDQHCLMSEKDVRGENKPQKAVVGAALSKKEVLSTAVEILTVVESTLSLPGANLEKAGVKTEAKASFEIAVETKSQVHEKESTHSEEYISEAVMISESSDSILESPFIAEPMEDVFSEENAQAVFRSRIKNATKINWFFNGNLLKSGSEFKCSKEQDTFSLVIGKVSKQKHEGEYVLEAENKTGKTWTTARLAVVKRGLMMAVFIHHRHLTSPSTV